MLRQLSAILFRRSFSSSSKLNFKVTICGATGGVGQPLAMLMRMHPLVTDLRLHDLEHTNGVTADLSHIDVDADIGSYIGPDKLKEALHCAHIVVIAAGFPRKPGMTRDDLFSVNAGIIKNIVSQVGKVCPKALIAIITNPLNTCVPIAAEVLKKIGVYDPNRLFGVTTIDLVRARKFLGDFMSIHPKTIKIPVIGGHAGETILPIISVMEPTYKGEQDDIKKLVTRIQHAGTEVVKAKAGAGAATLSMAYAGASFINSLLRGLNGEKYVIDYSYVESNVTEVRFFSSALVMGKDGIKQNLGLPKLNSCEETQLKAALETLKKTIKAGVDYVEKEK